MRRDQERALIAYQNVATVGDPREREKYRTTVKSLGSEIIRSGLSAALAFLERGKKEPAIVSLLEHLAGSGIPGVPEGCSGAHLPGAIRGLDAGEYMLATREMLALCLWYKRAVDATFED